MKLPFDEPRVWLRILLKGLIVLVVLDTLFIVLRPFDTILSYSLFGTFAPKRERLIVPNTNETDQIMPLETLLNAHTISAPKAPDEFRVVILGDSGINGLGNPDTETISSYLTQVGLTVQNKRVKAYNLAAIGPSISRDLLIADASLSYQPDLIISFVTLWSLRDDQPPDPLVEVNQLRMTRLTTKFNLTDSAANTYGHFQDYWWTHSILFERSAVYRWIRFQAYALYPHDLSGISGNAVRQAMRQRLFEESVPMDTMALPNATWDSLSALARISTVPTMIVNEPIQIESDLDAMYDPMYTRAAYDRYRQVLSKFCQDDHLWCVDLWNLLPEADFTDHPLHHTAQGNQAIATRISEEIQHVQDKIGDH